ncbi:MAG TPA: EAL domain-containing protein [Burkholderiales bacterium]|nr:EAL domain-containing protein [Burkholderiales bacterium]HYA47202.1 EAL domain-containing protein [Burkholderiales bacterium]
MRLGLGAKFTLTVLIFLAVTTAANTLYDLEASARFHEQQLIERGRALGRLIALVSPEAILGFDFLLLNDYTREVSTQPDVVYGAIMSPQGEVLSSHIDETEPFVKRHMQNVPRNVVDLLKTPAARDELINLRFPISHDGTILGHFLVGLSREALHEEFRRQLAVKLLALAAVVLFLSIAIHTVFRYRVLQPVQKLIAASRDVGRGLHALVEVKSSDELGLLTRAFNTMAEGVRQEQDKLHRQANFDTLTGLPNRLMAFDRINVEINRARRSGQKFAVFFVDLDNFKNVNDSLGHATGDRLLIAIGNRVQATLREGDTVARLGGDEFLVLACDVVGEMHAEKIAERLLQAVAEPQELGGRRVIAQSSIGIALFPDNGEDAETLVANADNAMYQAKTNHRGSFTFFTNEMNTRLRKRVQLEQDLRGAIEAGQLKLAFQPIVDTAGRRHRGAEVLLRWNHPERGAISPAEFVPIAENDGQIVGIGDWVLEQACRCWSRWRESGIHPGFLAINISRIQFRRRFSARLTELMSAYGVPPEALELEITESVLLDDHHQVAEELDRLRATGVKLSLDDFGTGYSSLSYLKRFRFDVLKIDRSFVAGLPDNEDDVLLVKAILAMAKGLDLAMVAEGVENEEQLGFVASQGCDFAQGYLFGKPMTDEAYFDYLKSLQARPEAPRMSFARRGRSNSLAVEEPLLRSKKEGE